MLTKTIRHTGLTTMKTGSTAESPTGDQGSRPSYLRSRDSRPTTLWCKRWRTVSRRRSGIGRRGEELRRDGRPAMRADNSGARSLTTASRALLTHDLPRASRIPASDATLVARARSKKHHGCRGEQPDTQACSPTRQLTVMLADPPTAAIAATDDGRARSPRNHATACSSPLSAPLSASQKGPLSRP